MKDPYKNYRLITSNGFDHFEYSVRRYYFFGLFYKTLKYTRNDGTKLQYFDAKEDVFVFIERDNSLSKGTVEKVSKVVYLPDQEDSDTKNNNLISFPTQHEEPQKF